MKNAAQTKNKFEIEAIERALRDTRQDANLPPAAHTHRRAEDER